MTYEQPGSTNSITRMKADYEGLCDRYTAILDRAGNEGRDPTSAEADELIQLRSEMEPIGDRIVELRETDERRWAAARAFEGGQSMSEMEARSAGFVPVAKGGLTDDARASSSGPAPDSGRGGIPPLMFGERQLREMMRAVEARSAYTADMEPQGPLQNRVTVSTPPASVIGTWPQPFSVTGREPRLAEYLNSGTADGNLVQFLRINNPAVSGFTAEGGPKLDSGLSIVRSVEQIQKWASWTDVTWEMVSDFADVAQMINTEMLGSIVSAENSYIIARILSSLPAPPVLVETTRLRALLELKQAVIGRSRGIEPDLVIVNPADVTTIIGEMADTAGSFMGGPSVIRDMLGWQVWGMRLVQNSNMTLGMALCGLSADVSFWIREGPMLIVDPYTQAKNNINTVIVEERGACGVTRPSTWANAQLPNPPAPGP